MKKMDKQFLFEVAVLVAGILCLLKGYLDRKGEKLSGVVSGFVNMDGYDFPMIRFQYNGQELEARAANGDKGNKMKHKEGDRVDIVYRPSKAKYVNILGDNHDIYILVALIVCGLVMVILRLISK